MSPNDKLAALLTHFRSRRATIDRSELETEISEARKPEQAGMALQKFCQRMEQYNVPLTHQEWDQLRQIAQALKVHINDLGSHVVQAL
jgi:hypothetical protein